MIMHVIIHKIISRTIFVNFYVVAILVMWPKSCVTETERDAQLNQADIPRGSSSCADESLAPRQESGSTAVRDETEVDATGPFLLIPFVVATHGSCGCCREGHHVHNVPTWSPASEPSYSNMRSDHPLAR